MKKEIPIWWKYYYNRFMEKVKEFRGWTIPKVPKFTEEEETTLDKFYKSDPLFGRYLELFYLNLYRLLRKIEEKDQISAQELTDIGSKCEYIRNVLTQKILSKNS